MRTPRKLFDQLRASQEKILHLQKERCFPIKVFILLVLFSKLTSLTSESGNHGGEGNNVWAPLEIFASIFCYLFLLGHECAKGFELLDGNIRGRGFDRMDNVEHDK